MPLQEDLFDSLSGSKYFSKVDLRQGYYQIRLAEGDEHLTTMRTRFGSYEFIMMQFGLMNAPTTFMMLMNHIFYDMLDHGVVIFLSILIYSKTLEEHEHLLEEVLKRLRENILFAKPNKCEFAIEEVEFLGHIITKDGMKPCEDKLKAIREWERPTSLIGTRSFISILSTSLRYLCVNPHPSVM